MSYQLQQAGTFRGTITEYGLFEPESGAVGVNIKASINEAWDSEAQSWVDWSEYDLETEGTAWIVKKGGGINQKSTESLIQYAGWDGSIESITNGTWKPTPCAFVVNEDNYRDEVRYRIAFINDHDRAPGGGGNVSPDRAKELSMQYGAQLRALAGNVARNAAPPAGKPKPPKAAKPPMVGGPVTAEARKALAKAKVTTSDPNAMLQEDANDDVPF